MKSKIASLILIFSLLAKFGFASVHVNYNLKMDSLSKGYSKHKAVSDSTKVVSKNKKYEPLAIFGAITSLISAPLLILGITSALSIPLLITLAGVIMSTLALLKIKKNKLKGKGLAIFGILFPIVFSVLLFSLVIFALSKIGAGGK
jgi:hypothetical protein